jgi:RNA polymerase sigma factor (sigma-70 family)
MPTEVPCCDAEALKTRRSLVSRLRNLDDRDSWQDFFDTYWKLIYSVALKAGLTEQEAEEVVQETTVAVMKYIQDFRYDPQVCRFKSWLMQKTQWRIIDQVRKRPPGFVERITPEGDSSLTPLIERIPDPESLQLDSLWEREWEKNLLEAAMERVKRRIKPEHFQIFYLGAVRNLGPKRIAETMGVNIAQVYLVRHRVAGLIRKEVRALEQRQFERG